MADGVALESKAGRRGIRLGEVGGRDATQLQSGPWHCLKCGWGADSKGCGRRAMGRRKTLADDVWGKSAEQATAGKTLM